MKCLAVLCALWLSVAPTLAAPAGPSPQIVAATPIRVGDTLDIQVTGEPSLCKSYPVDASGQISMEMAGQIPVAGRSTDQVADVLRGRLGRFLKLVTVTVSMNTSLRQEVTITGEVLRPGAVKLRPGDGLLDALAAVGGVGPTADASRATLVRRGQSQTQPLSLDRLLKGDLSQNMPLSDGDIIQVPRKEAAEFQVLGEVRQPGTRSLEGNVTVLDAILRAGGLTDRADRGHVTLARKDQAQPISIDLDQVLSGESGANLPIQANDVLTIASRMLIQVAGEVRAPGERLLRNSGTLMEAVLLAGGFSPDADRAVIQITHRDGTTETATLADVTSVVGGPALRPGDLVIVNRGTSQSVTITGAVRNSGQMRYQNGMKISDALMAAGLQENAQWKEIRVLRGEDGASRKILKFNLEAYLKAPQAENLILEAGDQIYVDVRRGGGGKDMMQRLREVMPLALLFF